MLNLYSQENLYYCSIHLADQIISVCKHNTEIVFLNKSSRLGVWAARIPPEKVFY